MTKEYLKMADVFDESVDSVEEHYGITNAIVDGSSATLGDFVTIKYAQYAAHAINSHDELVAEVKKLRSELADAWFMVDEIKLSLDRRSRQAEYWESIAKE